jgi:hypothetical protein
MVPAVNGPRLSVGDTETATFRWLPPVGTAPSAAGDFSADVFPLVTVCRELSTASGPTTCTEIVASFHRDATSPANLLTVDAEQEFYEGVWNTPAPNSTPFGAAYRLTVYPTLTPAGLELGQIRLRISADGSILRPDGSALRAWRQGIPCPSGSASTDRAPTAWRRGLVRRRPYAYAARSGAAVLPAGRESGRVPYCAHAVRGTGPVPARAASAV